VAFSNQTAITFDALELIISAISLHDVWVKDLERGLLASLFRPKNHGGLAVIDVTLDSPTPDAFPNEVARHLLGRLLVHPITLNCFKTNLPPVGGRTTAG
jgi:hypothetical protein